MDEVRSARPQSGRAGGLGHAASGGSVPSEARRAAGRALARPRGATKYVGAGRDGGTLAGARKEGPIRPEWRVSRRGRDLYIVQLSL